MREPIQRRDAEFSEHNEQPADGAHARRHRSLTIVDVVDETADAKTLILAPQLEDKEPFFYRPGQYLTLRIPSERTGSVARSYSLSSAPGVDDRLAVTIKRTASGYGSNWLCDHARPGLELDVLPPAGVFTPRNLDASVLLFAGGSGITPILSIVKSLLANNGSAFLVYANRDEASVIFRAQLAELVGVYPQRLTVVHWLESVSGLPTRDGLATLTAPYGDRDVFICGPGPYIEAASDAARDVGVPERRVIREIYRSLSGNPFERETELAPAPRGRTVKAEVDLDGTLHRFDWPENQTLLEVLESLGLDAPFSCREGDCGTCQAFLISGGVRMRENKVLEQRDISQGAILGCTSVPDTDQMIRIRF